MPCSSRASGPRKHTLGPWLTIARAAARWAQDLTERSLDADEQNGVEPSFFSNRWRTMYIAASLLLIVGSIVGWVVMFVQFDCPFAKGMVSIALISGLVLLAASCYSEQAGMLPGAVVMSYVARRRHAIGCDRRSERRRVTRRGVVRTIAADGGCVGTGANRTRFRAHTHTPHNTHLAGSPG